MNPTTALPIAAAIHLVAANGCVGRTTGVDYLISAPAGLPSSGSTAVATQIEDFTLTPDELAGFHRLNANPPALATEVFDRFRGKVAQS